MSGVLHADQIDFLEHLTALKQKMHKCKVGQTSLWDPALDKIGEIQNELSAQELID